LAPDSVLRALPELALELREAETVADKLRDTARAALRDAFAARDMEGFRNAYQALGIMGEGADGGGTKPAISRDRERTPKYTTPKTSPNPTTISLTSTLAPLLERLRTPTDLASFYVHLLDEMGSFIAFAEEAGIHEDIPAWLSSILTRWLEDEARASAPGNRDDKGIITITIFLDARAFTSGGRRRLHLGEGSPARPAPPRDHPFLHHRVGRGRATRTRSRRSPVRAFGTACS
jgi:hypothetical protein